MGWEVSFARCTLPPTRTGSDRAAFGDSGSNGGAGGGTAAGNRPEPKPLQTPVGTDAPARPLIPIAGTPSVVSMMAAARSGIAESVGMTADKSALGTTLERCSVAGLRGVEGGTGASRCAAHCPTGNSSPDNSGIKTPTPKTTPCARAETETVQDLRDVSKVSTKTRSNMMFPFPPRAHRGRRDGISRLFATGGNSPDRSTDVALRGDRKAPRRALSKSNARPSRHR